MDITTAKKTKLYNPRGIEELQVVFDNDDVYQILPDIAIMSYVSDGRMSVSSAMQDVIASLGYINSSSNLSKSLSDSELMASIQPRRFNTLAERSEFVDYMKTQLLYELDKLQDEKVSSDTTSLIQMIKDKYSQYVNKDSNNDKDKDKEE